jgi:hypothetical protein
MTPAVAVAWEATPKDKEFDIWLSEGSLTVICAVPGAAISAAETVAVKIPPVPNVVESGVPFHSRTEDEVNPEPSAHSTNAPPPAIAYEVEAVKFVTLLRTSGTTGGGGGCEFPPPPPHAERKSAAATMMVKAAALSRP